MIDIIKKERKYTVYMHICPNGKKYVGITQMQPKDRWKNGAGYKHNIHFQDAIKKYKWNNIIHVILYCGLSKDMAERKEIELISEHKSNNRKFGYNIDNGGNTQGTHSEETKQKMRNAIKLNKKGFCGKTHTSETRAKMSKNRKGLTSGKNHWHYGKHWDEKTLKKMRESHNKKVRCVETNILYNSLKDAESQTNINRTAISACCRHIKHHITAGGYHWKFEKELA